MTGRKVAALVAFDVAALLLVAFFVMLAVWQVNRRAWKQDLIARVDARVTASPVPAPGPRHWADTSAAADEYRRVFVTGEWLDDRSALVQAVTKLGGGYWVMTPLARDDGTTVLINRGFVPADRSHQDFRRPSGSKPVTVTGLLRISEPNGAFTRTNDPAANRWFSRDVPVIAASRGLSGVAPYFIDAERASDHHGLPVAGLTVISFSDNHLVYALTWGALALMAAAGAIFVNRDLMRTDRRRPHAADTELAGNGDS